MKKAITILAVLIVLVGAVFATTTNEDHAIKLRAVVGETLPSFQLIMTDGVKGTNAGYVTNSVATNTFGTNASYPLTAQANSAAVDIDFDLTKADSVTATCNIVNYDKVKTTKAFEISFDDGVFTVDIGEDEDVPYRPASITTGKGAVTDGIKSIEFKTGATGTNKPVVVTFNGTKMAENAAYAVATATYAYPGNDSINPTAPNEYYYANVTMRITADI